MLPALRKSAGLSLRGAVPRLSRSLTTNRTITDHTTGRIITLTDPERPEIADYPNPKPEFAQFKDPYAKYDDQQNRRNLNDPVNIDDDLYDMWSPDVFNHTSDSTALERIGIFFSRVFGFGAAIWYFELNPAKPAMPRSYPYGGLAKTLGAGSEDDEGFYRVKPDTSAEQELGFLQADNTIAEQKDAYIKENSDFISA